MNGKQKFYLLLGIFQVVLIAIVLFSVNFITGAVAQTASDATASPDYTYALGLGIGAGLAVGLAGVGAGIAIKTTGTAAISVLTEDESNFFKSFLVVALGEALAIYGLIISILLWTKIPSL